MKKKYLVVIFSLLMVSNSFAGAGFSKCIDGVVDCIGKTGEFLEKAGDCIGKAGKQMKESVEEIEFESANDTKTEKVEEKIEEVKELTVEETINKTTNTTEIIK